MRPAPADGTDSVFGGERQGQEICRATNRDDLQKSASWERQLCRPRSDFTMHQNRCNRPIQSIDGSHQPVFIAAIGVLVVIPKARAFTSGPRDLAWSAR